MVTHNGKVRVILLAAAGMIVTACTSFPAWRAQALRDLTEGRIRPPGPTTGLATPSRTTEFYDASGQHLGYGVSRGGSVDVYGRDGSRVGYGRAGP